MPIERVRSQEMAVDDLGFFPLRLARQPEVIPGADRVVHNNGLAAVDAEIGRKHSLGALTISDILLDVGISPYTPWPKTTEFRNID